MSFSGIGGSGSHPDYANYQSISSGSAEKTTSSEKTADTKKIDTLTSGGIAPRSSVSSALLAADTPELNPVDREAVTAFYEKVDGLRNEIDKIGRSLKRTADNNGVKNAYMEVSAAVDLFIASNELAMIMIKIALADSKLQQKVMNGIISMALEMYQLTIAIGDIKAKQHMADAQQHLAKAITQGLLIGFLSVNAIGTSIAKNSAFAEYTRSGTPITPQIRASVTESVMRESTQRESFFRAGIEATESAVGASVSLAKADFAKSEAQYEAAKQLMNQVINIMQETVNKLREGQSDIQKALQTIWDNVDAMKRAISQAWQA